MNAKVLMFFQRYVYARAVWLAQRLQFFMLRENFYDKDFYYALSVFIAKCKRYIRDNT